MDNQISNEMKDYFGHDASLLKNKKLFLFDMDGTIYEEYRLFDGTLKLLEQITVSGGRYVFITNNSSKSVADYVKKINHMGIKADRDNFFTSTQATILYINANYPKSIVYCQGTKSFVKELEDSGIQVTEDDREDIGVILVGFDMELTSEKVNRTCKLLQTLDAPFLATNPDRACPVGFGFIPDCGSICKMLENATGRKPIYIGKPEPTMVKIVMDKFHTTAAETVLIGDRLYTDIASGINAGIDTICVLTGEAKESDIVMSDIKPTFTFLSVKEISELIQ